MQFVDQRFGIGESARMKIPLAIVLLPIVNVEFCDVLGILVSDKL